MILRTRHNAYVTIGGIGVIYCQGHDRGLVASWQFTDRFVPSDKIAVRNELQTEKYITKNIFTLLEQYSNKYLYIYNISLYQQIVTQLYQATDVLETSAALTKMAIQIATQLKYKRNSSYILRSQMRTVFPAAEYRTVPREFKTTSVIFVSPGGQVACRAEVLLNEVPSAINPEDLTATVPNNLNHHLWIKFIIANYKNHKSRYIL